MSSTRKELLPRATRMGWSLPMVAIGKLQPIRVARGNNSFLVELIGEPNGVSCAYSIQSQVITKLVGGNSSFDIGAIYGSRERPEAFIFRAFAASPCIWPFTHNMYFAACYHAVIASRIGNSQSLVSFL